MLLINHLYVYIVIMKTVYLTRRFHFESAHRMFNTSFSKAENNEYFGKCQNVHGHNYILEVTVAGNIDPEKGYFVNLHDLLSDIQNKVIDKIDHQYLNDILPSCKNMPVTIEVVAQWIWDNLNKELSQYDFSKLRLWETPDNSVEIYK